MTRAVIFVISAGSTPYALAEKAIQGLGREHIIGTVLNRAGAIPRHWSRYYAYDDQPEASVDGGPAGQTSAAEKPNVRQLRP
jgi:Mrp family chromosome partitioning ATPase